MALKNAPIYGKFLSPELIKSYNRAWNFCIGSRSVGKSTAFSILLLKEYLESQKKFIYMRRTKDELLVSCRNYFDNAVYLLNNFGYNIEGFRYFSGKYYVKLDGKEKECGMAVPLSQQQKYKSVNFQEYYNLIYDEFISTSTSKYLGTKENFTYEYDEIYSFFVSMDRGIGKPFRDEVKFYFLANNASFYNPLFIALGIDEYLTTETKICAPKNKPWIVQQVNEVEATKDFMNSNAYLLASDKEKDYTFRNIALDTSNAFVQKINAPMQALLNIQYKDHKMGIYRLGKTIYISNTIGKLPVLALTTNDHNRINYKLAEKYRDNAVMIAVKDAYKSGDIIFETHKCKFDLSNYLMFTN